MAAVRFKKNGIGYSNALIAQPVPSLGCGIPKDEGITERLPFEFIY